MSNTGGELPPKNIDDWNADDKTRKEQIEKITREKESQEKYKFIDFLELLNYPFDNDPNRVLGKDGWLTKGSSCLWIGESGIGKSSSCFQAAINWAVGDGFFGIKPVYKPLKSIILQSEDDLADMGRCAQGITFGHGYQNDPAKLELLTKNILPAREELRGADLERWLRSQAKEHLPDLIFINPLLAFCDGDISHEPDAKKMCSIFNAIGKEFGCCFHVFHHTPKPKEEESASNYNYAGFGSSYLTNWARAIMIFRKIEEKRFELIAGKRGARSGMIGIDGRKETKIPLKHADHSVCWLYDRGETFKDQWNDLVLFQHAIGNEKDYVPSELVLRNLKGNKRSDSDARIIYKTMLARYNLEDIESPGMFVGDAGFWFKASGRDKWFKLEPKKNENNSVSAKPMV